MNRTLQNPVETSDIWRPDVTVATIVPRDGKFLLVEEMVHGRRVLNQPAGHLESHESLHDAACRETLEETGWTVELTGFVAVYQWSNAAGNGHFVRFTFVGKPVAHDAARPLDTRHRPRMLAEPRRDRRALGANCAVRWCCAASTIS